MKFMYFLNSNNFLAVNVNSFNKNMLEIKY